MAVIADQQVRVGGITVANCVFDGVMAGVVVDESGGVGIGCPIPKQLLQWFR